MEEKISKENSDALFINLVSSLYSTSMHFLGKIMNPVSGKIEKNLDAARTNIEMLRMLREKTAGNLSDEESRILGDALSNMQMNYLDEVEKSKSGQEQKNAGKEEAEGAGNPGSGEQKAEEKAKDEE